MSALKWNKIKAKWNEIMKGKQFCIKKRHFIWTHYWWLYGACCVLSASHMHHDILFIRRYFFLFEEWTKKTYGESEYIRESCSGGCAIGKQFPISVFIFLGFFSFEHEIHMKCSFRGIFIFSSIGNEWEMKSGPLLHPFQWNRVCVCCRVCE